MLVATEDMQAPSLLTALHPNLHSVLQPEAPTSLGNSLWFYKETLPVRVNQFPLCAWASQACLSFGQVTIEFSSPNLSFPVFYANTVWSGGPCLRHCGSLWGFPTVLPQTYSGGWVSLSSGSPEIASLFRKRERRRFRACPE